MERLMVTPVALTPSSGVDDDVPVRAVTPLKVWKLLTVDTLRPFLHRPAEDENGPLLMEISQLVSTYGPVLAAVGLDARLSEWALQSRRGDATLCVCSHSS